MRAASARGTPWATSPWSSVPGSVLARPRIISEKKIPIESTRAEFWNVVAMPGAGAAPVRRQAVHDPGLVRRGEEPHPEADHQQQQAEPDVVEVHRQELEQEEGERRNQHAAGRERTCAEVVGEVSRRRPGDQEADGQRQHVDAGPERRLREAVAVQRQPDALQPHDQHEHEPAAAERGQQRGDVAGREGADAEQAEPEHRIRDARLDHGEDGEQQQARRPCSRAPSATSTPSCARRRAGCRR